MRSKFDFLASDRPGARVAGEAAGVIPTVAAASIALVVALGLMGGERAFHEGGPVEILSALGYLTAAVVTAVSATLTRTDRTDRLLAAALLLVLFARETDWHRSELLGSLTRIATYLDPARPLALRVAALAILMGVAALVVLFVRRAYERWRSGRLAPTLTVLGVALAAAILAVAKVLDGFGRIFDGLIAIAPGTTVRLMMIEEGLELVAPVLLLAVALASLAAPLRSAISVHDRPGASARATRCRPPSEGSA